MEMRTRRSYASFLQRRTKTSYFKQGW
uniref:Uncharacterized protein n=1 Tax=Arundo donax TaxID=35708 RepID=A0A0A9BRJ6_ARUDO